MVQVFTDDASKQRLLFSKNKPPVHDPSKKENKAQKTSITEKKKFTKAATNGMKQYNTQGNKLL